MSIKSINTQSFVFESQLLDICSDLKNSNSTAFLEKFSKVPTEMQRKIFKYQEEILGETSQNFQIGKLTFLNLENHSCSNIDKIEAVERLIAHLVKKHLSLIAKDFEYGDGDRAHANFSQVCSLSKRVELLNDLEDDIYFQTWKALKKPDVLGIGESTFKEVTNDRKKLEIKAKALNKYIEVLSSFSVLSSEKANKLFLKKIIREKCGIVVVGGSYTFDKNDKHFRNHVFNDIKKLLSCELGRDLFYYIDSKSKRHLLEIVETVWPTCVFGFAKDDDTHLKRSLGIFSHSQNLNSPYRTIHDSLGIVMNPDTHQLEIGEVSSDIILAHELCHYFNILNSYSSSSSPSKSLWYTNLEEKIAITGMGEGKYNRFNENEFNKAFKLPLRVGHLGFDKRDANSPLHFACFLGSCESVETCLKQGINPNIQNQKGKSPIRLASESPFAFEDPNKIKKIIDLLIACGGNIQEVDKYGNTPLHQVAYEIEQIAGYHDGQKTCEPKYGIKISGDCLFGIYDYLISKGADPHAKNKEKRSKSPHEMVEPIRLKFDENAS